jgi:hypothetical protein
MSDQHDARQDGRDAQYEGWGQSGPLTSRQGNGPGSGFGLQKSFGRYARAYTVQFSVFPPSLGFDATADITFSIAGQSITRRVSVGNAVSLTGLCQAINIQIYDTTSIIPTVNIANVTAGPGGLIEITTGAGNQQLSAGGTVQIAGVTGTIEANGTWIVASVISNTQFLLKGSIFVNAYTGGGTSANITPQPYAAAVTVSPGTRGSTAIPPTLKGVANSTSGAAVLSNGGVGVQSLPDASSVTYNVPNGVGVVSCEVSAINSNPANTNLIVSFLDNSGSIEIKKFPITANTDGYPIFVDVPANCGMVTISNNDSTGGDGAQVALTWGIDG